MKKRRRWVIPVLVLVILPLLACETCNLGAPASGVPVSVAPTPVREGQTMVVVASDVLGGGCTIAYATSSLNPDLICSSDCRNSEGKMTWRSLSHPGVCYNSQQPSPGGSSSPPAGNSPGAQPLVTTAVPISADFGEQIAQLALSRVGKNEWAPGRSDQPINRCTDFASGVLKEAGAPFTGGLEDGWLLDHHTWMRDWFEANGLWFTDLTQIRPGDALQFSWGHSAIAVAINHETKMVTTVEYNDGRVEKLEHALNHENFRGFGRPTQTPIVRSVPRTAGEVVVGGERIPVKEVRPGVYEFWVTVTDPNDPESYQYSTDRPTGSQQPSVPKGNGLCSEFHEYCRLKGAVPAYEGSFYHPERGECCCTRDVSFIGKSGIPEEYGCPAAICVPSVERCDPECWEVCALRGKEDGGYLENGVCKCHVFKNVLSNTTTLEMK